MKPWTLRNVFTCKELELYRRAKTLVEDLRTHLDPHGREIRCHELAAAVKDLLGGPIRLVHGKFSSIEHSWLELRVDGGVTRDSGRRAILDVYLPGAVPQVALIDPHPFTPWAKAYQEGSSPGLRWDVAAWLAKKLRESEATRKRAARELSENLK